MTGRSTRTPRAQARGLGAAKHGAGHWWAQRVTAVALVPLTAWFTISLVMLVGRDHGAFVAWLQAPHNTILATAFVVAVFHHMALGLQVVVEDYVHRDRTRVTALMLVQIGCAAFALTGVVSILRTVS